MMEKISKANPIYQSIYSFLEWFATGPNEKHNTDVKKMVLVGIHLLLLPYIWLMVLIYSYALETNKFLVFGTGFSVWIFAYIFVLPRLQKDIIWWGNIAGIGEIISLVSFTIISGGFENSGYLLPLLGLANPLVALINLKPRNSTFWLLIHIASVLAIIFLQPYLPRYTIPLTVSNIAFAVNCIVSSILYFSFLIYFINQRDEAFQLLSFEKEKSENLLLNIFPVEIAAVLKNENRVIAEHFKRVSILFADVVNFTPMSASMTPTELVELLNEVYSHFDALVEKYELEKIKTIGDCYMVAAGVPRRRSDHALVLTQLALDIRDFVSQHEFQGHQLKFRIGINSGSVVAGVIGKKKFAYDLWGDAVNTASRMESHGTGGFIQITEDTYALIKSDFNCESRGKINIKGKGEISVWYVIDRF